MENVDKAKSIDYSDNEISNNDEHNDNSDSHKNVCHDDTESQGTENDLTIRMEVATCQGITVDKISAQVWHDAKLRIRRLLDRSLTQAEREQIAASLTDMCDRLETKNILETNIPRNVQLAIQLGAGGAIGHANQSSSASVESFNDRLRERIAEFNHGLVSLADGISRLKNKLLTIEYCAPTYRNDSIDVHVCRNIHKNFRRILQKESRFLRDELFAAKETIYRLERRGSSPIHPDDEQQQSTQLVPYHQEYSPSFHPAAYFNVEHAPPLWPHDAAPPFMAYPAMWERMYAHPELSRQLQSYDNACDPSTQGLLPQPICTSSNAIAILQPSSAWVPIGRSLTDNSSQRHPEECSVEEKKS